MTKPNFPVLKKLKIDLWLLILIFLSGLLPFSTSLWKSNVWDEPYYIVDGFMYLNKLIVNPGLEKSILTSVLSALPLLFLPVHVRPEYMNWQIGNPDGNIAIERKFLFHSPVSPETILFYSRLSSIFLTVLLAYFIYCWARKYYGLTAARISLILLVFCPLITSFGGLAVTDLPVSAMGLVSLYLMTRYFRFPDWKNTLITGIVLGLTLSIKVSGILFLFLFFLFLILYGIRNFQIEKNIFNQSYLTILYRSIFITIISLFIANLWFLPTNDPLGYFHSLEYTRKHLYIGHKSFLFGHYSEKGWWYYYPAAFLIKTPIPLLIFLVISIVTIPWKKWKIEWNYRIPIDLFLWISVISWVGFAMTNTINIGIRHILPVYPMTILLTGKTIIRIWNNYAPGTRLSENLRNKSFWRYRGITILLFLWYIYSWIRIYPYDLAYFNEWVGGPGNGYKYLVDSNLDWGQDLRNLKNWLDKNQIDSVSLHYFGNADTEYYGLQKMSYPKSIEDWHGYIAISVTDLQAVYLPNKEIYQWLREHQPIAQIGYSIMIYHLPEKELK